MTITVIWIVISVVAGVIDALTSSFFFFLFSIGAFAAAVGSAVDVPFLYQIIIFATISILLISFVYPVLKKKFKADVKKTLLMEEKYIGKTMISLAKVSKQEKAHPYSHSTMALPQQMVNPISATSSLVP